MEFSTREFQFKAEERNREEQFLHKMEKKISQVHKHYDGTPVELHTEVKSHYFDDDGSPSKESREDVVRQVHSAKADYGHSGSEVSFGCNCGKKWEAIFKGDVIEVNELPLNLQGGQGYNSSSSHGYGSSGSRKTGYNLDSGYGHSGSSKKNDFYH